MSEAGRRRFLARGASAAWSLAAASRVGGGGALRAGRLAVPLSSAALAAACSRSDERPRFRNTDITGAEFARSFSLTGHDGQPRTLDSFKGKVVTVFFGFTQCPDVCPTTLAEMAEVMKLLGPDADRVQALFVTVDPERDTPELLSKYVPAFDPRFLGLYGSADEIARTAREFRVFYQKVPGKAPGQYQVDHTAASFVFDPQGKVRLYVKYGQGAEPLAHDIRLLLGAPRGRG
jgi:protein SCO1/2